MKDLNIKNIWKEAFPEGSGEKKYSMEEIEAYRKQKSKDMSKTMRRAILFDIGYKGVVSLAFVLLIILLFGQFSSQVINGALLFVCVSLIFVEWEFVKKLKGIKETDTIIGNLQNKLNYLKTFYNQFTYLGALSNPLFMLAGFFLYFYFKYGEIRMASSFQDPVLYIFLVIGFLVALFGARPFYKTQVRELSECMQDMDDNYMASRKMVEQKKKKWRYVIWFGVLAFVGLMVFLIILLLNKS